MKKTNKGTLIYDKGETIIREGEKDKSIFFLISGKIGVYKGDKLVACISQPNSPIGEISAILDTPRTATCIALEESELVVYKGGIDEIITKFPKTAKAIIKNLAERLAKSTSSYIEGGDSHHIAHTIKQGSVPSSDSSEAYSSKSMFELLQGVPDELFLKIISNLNEKELALTFHLSPQNVKARFQRFLPSRKLETLKDIIGYYSKFGYSEVEIKTLEEKVVELAQVIQQSNQQVQKEVGK
jgi:CRP-like cAMP-binding protein